MELALVKMEFRLMHDLFSNRIVMRANDACINITVIKRLNFVSVVIKLFSTCEKFTPPEEVHI